MKTVEKTCKECSQQFIIKYENTGRGSGNCSRRSICSSGCRTARKLRSRSDVGRKVELTCKVCDRTYRLYPSQAKISKTCSKECRREYQRQIVTRVETRTITCVTCNAGFVTKNTKRKFCSQGCAKNASLRRVERTCEICSKKTLQKQSCKSRFCSKDCTALAQSRGLVATHVNGRSGYRSDLGDLYFKSSFEADYCRFLRWTNQPFEYESKTFTITVNGKQRYYTPDVYLCERDVYLELKGVPKGNSKFSQLLNSNAQAREAVTGANIEVVYMNDFYKMLRECGLYAQIPNLENRNYAQTKHLIVKRVSSSKS